MTPSWQIGSSRKCPPADKSRPTSNGDRYTDRRLRTTTVRHRGAPFPRVSYVAEWDHPAKSGLVKRHHFGSREEAIAALHEPSPFDLAQQFPERREPTGNEEWFLCRA